MLAKRREDGRVILTIHLCQSRAEGEAVKFGDEMTRGCGILNCGNDVLENPRGQLTAKSAK